MSEPEPLSSLWEAIGLPTECRPDEDSPPVDEAALQRLARGELGPEAADDVTENIVSYRPWRVAYSATLARELSPSTAPLPLDTAVAGATLLDTLRSDTGADSGWEAYCREYLPVIDAWLALTVPAAEIEETRLQLLGSLYRRAKSEDRAPGRYRSWLERVVTGALADWKNSGPVWTAAHSRGPVAVLEDADSLLALLEDDWRAKVAERAEASLEDEFDETAWAAYYQLTYGARLDAVAQALGIPVGDVLSLANKVRVRVNKAVAHELAADGG